MLGWYGVLKVVHVLSAIAWIGGGAALAVITARMVRAGDRTALAAFLPHSARYGPAIAGPASGLVLLTGIAMVLVGHLGFRTLWVGLGFGGIVLHIAFGAIVMRRRLMAFAQAVTAAPADDARLAQAGRRLWRGSLLYLLIMTSVIAVMVLKPTV